MKKLVALLVCLVVCSPVFAQNISVDLKDAPVRTTLEMMFKQAGIKNYVIENSVAGFVTMKLEDQPFENSLKLVMRAATVPLTVGVLYCAKDFTPNMLKNNKNAMTFFQL